MFLLGILASFGVSGGGGEGFLGRGSGWGGGGVGRKGGLLYGKVGVVGVVEVVGGRDGG